MPADQSQAKHGFRPTRISTTELAKEEFGQVLGLSDVDEADNVDESESEASSESNTKFTMWDV